MGNRQKFYIVDWGDKIYASVFTKLEDAEKERENYLKQGYRVKIKIGYRYE